MRKGNDALKRFFFYLVCLPVLFFSVFKSSFKNVSCLNFFYI